jgi:hypothetical protein
MPIVITGVVDDTPVAASLVDDQSLTGEVRRLFASHGFVLRTAQEDDDMDRTYEQRGADRKCTELAAAIADYFKNYVGDTETGNGLLEHLSMPLISNKWRVAVNFQGTTVLTVIVEADDEYDAIRMVEGNISVISPDLEFEFEGDGEVEDSDTVEIDGDEYVSDAGGFDFEAEEYDGE